MIDNGLGSQLMPSQPLLEKIIGQQSPAFNATTVVSSGVLAESAD
jgi:hypothetical protein